MFNKRLLDDSGIVCCMFTLVHEACEWVLERNLCRPACSQWNVYLDDHGTISCNCPCNCLSSVVLRFATRCEWSAMCADMLEQRLNTRMASVTFLTKGNRCKRKPLTFS